MHVAGVSVSRFLLACILHGAWRVVCSGYPEIWRESQALIKLSCGTICFPYSVKVFFICTPYVAYQVFLLLYFSLNVNNDSLCANVVRKKSLKEQSYTSLN